MLSSRLKAFVIPTSQTTATMVASKSLPISSTRRPAATAIPAAANCAASFASGLRCRTSSTSPAAKSERAPARIPPARALASTAPVTTAAATPASRPAKIPTPPNVGVARSCQRSPVGWATSRSASDGVREPRRTRQAARQGGDRAAAVTARKGRAGARACVRRHGGTYTAAAMSVYADLVRYRDLFASLFRRDLRAKYKGSVLGLAWTLANPLLLMLVYLVVFSVLWQATATRLRPLLAVPALRPAGLGLLRDVAAGGGAEPAREREPDPQGALPAPARAALDRGDAARRLRGDAGDRARPLPRLRAGLARHGLARAPRRGRVRALRRRPLARGHVGQRGLPRRPARRRGAAPAVVLPDADPLPARGRPGRRRAPVARRPDPLGQPALAGGRDDPRRRSSTARRRRSRTRSTSVVAAVVSLALGAFVFRRLDDRIAVEV